MSFVSRTVGALHPRYLARAYVIGFVLFAFLAWVTLTTPDDHGEPIAI